MADPEKKNKREERAWEEEREWNCKNEKKMGLTPFLYQPMSNWVDPATTIPTGLSKPTQLKPSSFFFFLFSAHPLVTAAPLPAVIFIPFARFLVLLR